MSIKEVQYKLPKELREILENIFTSSQLDSIYRSYDNGRNSSFRINNLKGQTKDVMKELMEKKIKAYSHPIIKSAFIVKGNKDTELKKLDSYKQGKIYLQNISSMLPAYLLELAENQAILDMCAAPGGKSLLMAEITNDKAIIFANDINKIRRERLTYNINKQGATSIVVVGNDGCTIGKGLNKYFDRILLDAPCTGEGIIHLKNNKKFRGWSERKVKSLVKLQKKLIESAYNALKQGGVIVYSTCTLNPFENEGVIDYILSKYDDLVIEKISLGFQNEKEGITSCYGKEYNMELRKSLRIIPNENMEGFFIAKLRKC